MMSKTFKKPIYTGIDSSLYWLQEFTQIITDLQVRKVCEICTLDTVGFNIKSNYKRHSSLFASCSTCHNLFPPFFFCCVCHLHRILKNPLTYVLSRSLCCSFHKKLNLHSHDGLQKSHLTSTLVYGPHTDLRMTGQQPAEYFARCSMLCAFPRAPLRLVHIAITIFSHLLAFPHTASSAHTRRGKQTVLAYVLENLKEQHWPLARNLHVKCWRGITFLVWLAVFSHLWHSAEGDWAGRVSTKSASHGNIPGNVRGMSHIAGTSEFVFKCQYSMD